MKIYISAFDRKTHTKLRLDDETKYIRLKNKFEMNKKDDENE